MLVPARNLGRLRARRGKLLNVRDASLTQVTGNAEIQNIKQIMGLQHGKVRAHAPGLAAGWCALLCVLRAGVWFAECVVITRQQLGKVRTCAQGPFRWDPD